MDSNNIPQYDTSKGAPHVSPELIGYLRSLFPNCLPLNPPKDIREIDMAYGRQQVIRHLEHVYSQQIKPTSEKD